MRVDQNTVAALAHQVYRILMYCGRVTFIHETFLETYREVAEANHLGGGLPYITYLPFVRRAVQDQFAKGFARTEEAREAVKPIPAAPPSREQTNPRQAGAHKKTPFTGKMAAANDRD